MKLLGIRSDDFSLSPYGLGIYLRKTFQTEEHDVAKENHNMVARLIAPILSRHSHDVVACLHDNEVAKFDRDWIEGHDMTMG